MKILAFDVETTGLTPAHHEIVQLSALMIVDGEVRDHVNLLVAPDHPERIDRKALEIQGRAVEVIREYMPRPTAFRQWQEWLGYHIDRFDNCDKAYPLAYCGNFDMGFLSAFHEAAGDRYLGSWINWKLIDPRALLNVLHMHGRLRDLPNFRLETVCEHAGIVLRAHDALEDIRATWALWQWAEKQLRQLYITQELQRA